MSDFYVRSAKRRRFYENRRRNTKVTASPHFGGLRDEPCQQGLTWRKSRYGRLIAMPLAGAADMSAASTLMAEISLRSERDGVSLARRIASSRGVLRR